MQHELVLAMLQSLPHLLHHLVHDGQLKEFTPFEHRHGLNQFLMAEDAVTDEAVEVALYDIHGYWDL
jgi:hypothetical protein